jgi:glycosyltransferase involved in cell wall biosynthesis
MSKFVAGGAETTALRLIDALHGRACEFVAAAVKGGGELAGPLRQTGAVVYDGLAKFKRDPLGPWRLARIIRRRRIDVVICVTAPRDALFYSTLAGLPACRCVPTICWCHSRPEGQSGNFVPRLRRYRKMGLLQSVVCITGAQRRMLVDLGLPRRRAPLIRNGIDPTRFAEASPVDLGVPAGVKTIVQVANVMPDKDFETLLAAGRLLKQRRGDFRIVLAGRGTDSAEMSAQIKAADLDDTIICAGHRDDIPGVLAAADVFVLSTKGEVSSIAVLEAFASGTPVAVSDIPAFDEMLIDGQEGLRAEAGVPQALADAMEKLLDDQSLAAKLTANARQRLRRYELSTMVGRFDRLLRAISQNRL